MFSLILIKKTVSRPLNPFQILALGGASSLGLHTLTGLLMAVLYHFNDQMCILFAFYSIRFSTLMHVLRLFNQPYKIKIFCWCVVVGGYIQFQPEQWTELSPSLVTLQCQMPWTKRSLDLASTMTAFGNLVISQCSATFFLWFGHEPSWTRYLGWLVGFNANFNTRTLSKRPSL